jgi:ATP/maltotriose-dependent transcriptional regulator MalT
MSVIARTKLEVPPARSGLVPRGALVSLLAGVAHTRLTLLSAPAGSGKTTLLSQWHQSTSEGQPFAWLSLDEGDDDPVRFWTCVIEALRVSVPGIGDRAEGALRSPGTSVDEVVVPLLVNELSAISHRTVLVLDDLHTVADERVHRSLIAFVERLPATMHLAIATRSDPPWPMLPRLRVRDQMVEIRRGQMRFNEDEAGSYLAGLGLDLAADQVISIQQRTEGWAAGLQLAGLSLRDNPAGHDVIAAPSGDDRHIADYLAAEVLDRVSADDRRFLLRTSILERMSGAMCDAVTDGEGADRRLAELELRNLFVVALDSQRRWYRYHHLFAELLRTRLTAEDADIVPELHRRAARWLANNGQVAEAIGHAIAANDHGMTAELVAAHWLTFFNRGWLATVHRWVSSLPTKAIEAEPQLWLARTWTAMDLGAVDEVADLLDRAPPAEPWVGVLRALRLLKLGDAGGAAQAASGAAHDATDDPFRVTVAALVGGMAAYWRGRHADARTELTRAADAALATGNALARQYALGYLALAAVDDDGPNAARELLSDPIADVDGEPQVGEHFTAMIGHLALGRAAELDGRLVEAERELARAGELARRGAGALERAAAALGHAGVLGALGRRDAARERMTDAQDVLAGCADPGILKRTLTQAQRTPGLVPPRAPVTLGEALSERELGVLRLLHSELSLREIGSELFVSHNTVKTHTRNIYLKLNAGGREEAVARARELGLI